MEGPVVGAFNDSNGGLGYAEWSGVDRAAAEAALRGLAAGNIAQRAPVVAQALAHRSTPADGPGRRTVQRGAHSQADGCRAVERCGGARGAGARAEGRRNLARASRRAAVRGRDADACGDATAFRLDSDDQFWIELRAYCYALGKDPALDLTRAVLGGSDPAFNALLDGVIAGKPRANVAFAKPTSLHVRMMQRLKLAMNAAVANLGTAGALIAAQSAATPREVRIAAAEKALRAGALPPSTLAQVLDLVGFKPNELDAAAAMARSGSPIVALARLRAALKRETNPEKRAELIYTALRVGEE